MDANMNVFLVLMLAWAFPTQVDPFSDDEDFKQAD